MEQKELLDKFTTWTTPSFKEAKGIIVGCSYHFEDFLPWWWYNYQQHNHYPIAFVDFGLSDKAKAWCKKKGTLLEKDIPDNFITREKDIGPKLLKIFHNNSADNLDKARLQWFKKPLAMIHTPFLHSIWIDLDCEIKGSLEKLFSLDGKTTRFSCLLESDQIQKAHVKLKIQKQNELTYNSGVVVFQHSCEIIKEWCRQTILNNHLFFGDQNVLSRIIYEKQYAVTPLPLIYNWVISHYSYNSEAIIYHWAGFEGKKVIALKTACLMSQNLLDTF